MSKRSTERDLVCGSWLSWCDSGMGNVCMKKGNPQNPAGILASFILHSEFFKDSVPWTCSVIQGMVYYLFDYFLFKVFVSNLIFSSGAHCPTWSVRTVPCTCQGSLLSCYYITSILPERSRANKDPCYLCSVVWVTSEHSFAEKVKHQKAFTLNK